jgi:hypothetical protein
MTSLDGKVAVGTRSGDVTGAVIEVGGGRCM